MAPAADREGYWGPPTSTLEWCEENYAVSYYIAEFCEWPPPAPAASVTFSPHPPPSSPDLRALTPPTRPRGSGIPPPPWPLFPEGSKWRDNGGPCPSASPGGWKWLFSCPLPPQIRVLTRGWCSPVSPLCPSVFFGPHPPIPSLSLWPVSEVMVGQEEGVRGFGEASRGWLGEVGHGGARHWSRGGRAAPCRWLKRGVFTQIVLGVRCCKAVGVCRSAPLERRWEHLPSHSRSNQTSSGREKVSG